jgi:1,4-dihydroxy-6-naphthoate synthase
MTTSTPTPTRTITLGHSPDPDDAFMFYGLAKDLLDTQELKFEHILQDIQTLNERATRGELDVTAISVHAYASVMDKYAVLPSGASMGDNYGPMIVTKTICTPEELAQKTIAVPGEMTSAFLTLKIWYAENGIRDFKYKVVPFDQIIEAVQSDEVDAGLLIHEGQLTFEKEGLKEIVNLGCWWYDRTDGLPLPLGCNAIKKELGEELMKRVSRYLTHSIKFSLENREAALEYALGWARGMETKLADEFVGMYVNELTLDYGERGREAIRRFLGEAHDLGFLDKKIDVEFVNDAE